MKAVILEVKNGDAAALKDDGTVVKIKDENYKVGDVIRMKEKKPLFNKKWGTLVAALLIFAMVGTSTYVNAAPSFDVWVEDDSDFGYELLFRLNKEGKVITVEDKNGRKTDEFSGLGIEEAIMKLADEADKDYKDLIITAASRKVEDAEKLKQRIEEALNNEEEIKDEEDDEERERKEVEAVGFEMVEEARAYSIAPGKLNIINKLFENAEDRIEIGDESYRDKEDFMAYIQDAIEDEEDTKPIMKELMKAYSESKGKESAPGQLKKQEEVQTQNRNTEQNTEENQEMNNNKPESNPGNKGGNGKGNGNN
jgi:hypothetical protein